MKQVPNASLREKSFTVNYASADIFILQFGWEQKLTRKRDCRSYPNDMMHCVNVAVSHIHPDGSDGETIVLP